MTLTTQEREDILCNISDLYKDVHGFRNRSMNYSLLSDSDLKEEYDYLLQQLNFVMEEQEQFEKKNYEEFKKHIASIQAMCNCSKRKALRFILDAHGLLKSKDYEYLCFQLGLNYNVAQEMKNY